MTTVAEDKKRLSEVIDPHVLSHSDWLWALGEEKLFTTNIRKRLRAIALLLGRRPDINCKGDFQFVVGATYPTLEGKLITIIRKTTTTGFECVIGSDNIARYNRSGKDGCADIGRVTGSNGSDLRNLIPLRIVDAGPLEQKARRAMCHLSNSPPATDQYGIPLTTKPRPYVYSPPLTGWRIKKGLVKGAVDIHMRDSGTALVSLKGMSQKFWVDTKKIINDQGTTFYDG